MKEGGAAGGRSQVFNIVERGRQRESGGVAVVIDLRSTSALEPTGNFIRNQQGERERERDRRPDWLIKLLTSEGRMQ